MTSIEITVGSQKYVLKGEESEEHLREVAEMVRRRVESLKRKMPSLSLQKAAMLAAFDLASDSIKGKRRAQEYRSQVISKAGQLLERVETAMASAPAFPRQ